MPEKYTIKCYTLNLVFFFFRCVRTYHRLHFRVNLLFNTMQELSLFDSPAYAVTPARARRVDRKRYSPAYAVAPARARCVDKKRYHTKPPPTISRETPNRDEDRGSDNPIKT